MRYFSVFLKKNYSISKNIRNFAPRNHCLLYTSDAADE